MRYIDADKIGYHFLHVVGHPVPEMLATEFEINAIPTADVAEVKHGKWISEKHIILDTTSVYIKWKCSNCGVVAKKGLSYDDINNYAPSYLYCPECGAKMDLEESKRDL